MKATSIIGAAALTTTALHAQEADLAQKLANPISDLISLPIQSNHDFGVGPGDGAISRTNIQPFLSCILPSHTTLSLNTETTYDWSNEEWTVPINFQVSQVFKIGDQPMQAFVGARYYADKPANGPEWGLRSGLTFLFPK